MSRSSRRRAKSSDTSLGLIIMAGLVVWMFVALIESPFSIVVAIALLGGGIWYGHVMALRHAEARRRWHDMQHVRGLSGVAFEHHVAELYGKLGYRSRVTRGGGDQGADVIAEDAHERLAIQCKQWTETVGNDAVQEAIAGKAFYGCDRAIVVCTTSFTSAARDLAERAKVTLITGEDYARLMARVRPTTLEVRTIRGVRVPSGKILTYELAMVAAAVVLVVAHLSTLTTPRVPIGVGGQSQASGPAVSSQVSGAPGSPVRLDSGARTQASAPAAPAPSLVSEAQGSSGQVDLSLRVAILRTSQASPQMQLRYPAVVHVRVPAQWSHLLAAYGIASVVLIAPNGWTGEGSKGADGSANATLSPETGSPVPAGSLSYTAIPACYGCALNESSRYFSWARESWSSLSGSIGFPMPPRRPLLHEVALAHELLAYQAPSTVDGLEVNGVAYSSVDRNNAGTQACASNCSLFKNEEIALPVSQHSLASAILNAFLAYSIP